MWNMCDGLLWILNLFFMPLSEKLFAAGHVKCYLPCSPQDDKSNSLDIRELYLGQYLLGLPILAFCLPDSQSGYNVELLLKLRMSCMG